MNFGIGVGNPLGGRGGGMGPGALRRMDSAFDSEDFGKAFDGKLFRRLLPYLKPYRKHALWAAVLTLFSTASNVITPYFFTLAIDKFINRHDRAGHQLSVDMHGLWIMCAFFVGVQVVYWWSTYGQQYLMTYAGQWALYR